MDVVFRKPRDTFRHLRQGLVDTVMEVAGGLHNLRVTARGCTLA